MIYPHLCVFQILLDSGADANRMYSLTRVAPIHVASRKGNCAILDLLLTHGADVNAVSSDGKTCLHVLATKCTSSSGEKKFLECLSRILNAKGAQVSWGCLMSGIIKPVQVTIMLSLPMNIVRYASFGTIG